MEEPKPIDFIHVAMCQIIQEKDCDKKEIKEYIETWLNMLEGD